MEIFWGSGSGPSWRVLLAAEIKKIPYESKLLSFQKGEHKSAEMLAVNPRGKVPAMRDGSFTLYESLAILSYLDEKYPEPTIFGKTAEERATTWRSVMELESYLGPAATKVTRPILFNQLAEKEAEVREGRAGLHDELAKLETALTTHAFLLRDQISAADLTAFPIVMAILRAANKESAKPFDLGLTPLDARYPKLAAWKAKIEALPNYDRTFPPHWRE